MTGADWNRFRQHAAPEAIEARISEVLKKKQRIDGEMTRLYELRAERATQVMRGEWPAKVAP